MTRFEEAPTRRVRMAGPGGGHLEFHGDPAARRVLLLAGRDDVVADAELVAQVIAYFRGRGETVVRYESHHREVLRQINPPFLRRLPTRWRILLRTALLLAVPARWRYFSGRHQARVRSIPERARGLSAAIGMLAAEREVVVLGRSAGARLASLVADSSGASRVVCLGYPFQHPDQGPDPDRTRHLSGVRTPMLILQGASDRYGGEDVARGIRLAPATMLEVVAGDHDLSLAGAAGRRLLDRIFEFCFGASADPDEAPPHRGRGPAGNRTRFR